MPHEYMVRHFVPAVKGCGAKDAGWDAERCRQFEAFLNVHAVDGWRLHSSEFRSVTVQNGCAATSGGVLVCVFEKLPHSGPPAFPR